MDIPLLKIDDLHVGVDGKEILHGIDLTIYEGEVHILFGPNGAGKSTLMKCIFGFPGFELVSGKIWFKGEDITDLNIEQRARKGIGLAFQNPPVVRGVTLRKLISGSMKFDEDELEKLAGDLNLVSHLDRDLNKGFSGGESKRAEILQILVQSPDFLMLDEPESGVDLENIELLATKLGQLLGRSATGKGHRLRSPKRSAFIISHTGLILNHLNADRGHVLLDGKIQCNANPFDILNVVREYGYSECLSCVREAAEEQISITELLRKRDMKERIINER